MGNKLKELISLYKGTVSIDINYHLNFCLNIPEYIDYANTSNRHIPQIVIDKCVELNNVVEIYCETVGNKNNLYVIHYEIDAAIDEMIRLIKDNQ